MSLPSLRAALQRALVAMREDAAEWCRGRMWHLRSVLLAFLAYEGIRHVVDPMHFGFFGGITFGIHELGHVVFSWAGRILTVAGGSILQIAAPVGATIVLLRQRDYFGVAVTIAWLAFSLSNLSVYVGDATAEELDLISMGGVPEHDWHTLLGEAGLLSWDRRFAAAIRAFAFVLWVGALAFGGWLCWRMRKSDGRPPGFSS